MKNKLIMFLFAAAFLASCGTVGITRRYHNSGFQISLNRGGNNGDQQPVKKQRERMAVKNEIANNELAAVAEEPVSAALPAEVVSPDVQVTEGIAAAPATGEKVTLKNARTAMKAVKVVKAEMKNLKAGQQQKKALDAKTDMQDVPDNPIMWILLFILCFIIPPLAYYLIRGEADLLFWICLICYLLAFGAFGVGFGTGGLVGLISVIIALLALFGS